jgi:dihydrofolate reductase
LDWHRPGSRFRCDLGTIRHLVMGRRTYEAASKRLGEAAFTGTTAIVFSRTMKQQDHPEVTVVSELNPDWVRTLQTRSGKDIWLFGGSELFRSFLGVCREYVSTSLTLRWRCIEQQTKSEAGNRRYFICSLGCVKLSV